MFLAAATCVLGCRSRHEEAELNFEERQPVSHARRGGQVIHFGLAAMISPRETAADYNALVRELGAAMGAKVELVHGKSYKEVNAWLTDGRVDLAFLCTGGYLELSTQIPVEVLAVPRVAGRTTYRSLIIVREGDEARSFLDLRRRRFVFTDPLSLSGYFFPASRLRTSGQDPDRFFASSEFVGSHDRSIQAVQRGAADAAAVDSLIYDRIRATGAAGGLRVLETSPELGIPPIVALTRLPAAERKRYREALIHLHERHAVRDELARIKIERFVLPPPDLYRSAEAIWRSGRRR